MSKTATYTAILMVATILSKLLGFGREVSLAYAYGTSAVCDAFVVAFSIPTIIFSGIGAAMLTSYIPIYTDLELQNPGELKKFHNATVTLAATVSLIILAVFLFFDKQIVFLFAPGYPDETFGMAVALSRVMMVSIVFIAVYFIIQGFLQIRGGFLAVGLVSVPLNLFVIAAILVSPKIDYMVMGYGTVGGYIASYLLLYIAAKRRGYTYLPCFAFSDPNIKRLVRLIMPIFLGKAIMQINVMIDRSIASVLPTGAVSALSYGNRIIGFVTAVFVVSVATAILPQMSRLSAINNEKKIKSTLVTSVGVMSLLVIPISAGAMVFSKEVVSLLFERGAFGADAVEKTAQVVVFYSVGLIFYSIKDVVISVFYAIQDTKTPTVNSAIAIGLNVALNLLLIKSMQHSGLALATSISSAVTMCLLFISLRRKLGPLGLKRLLVSLLKMMLSSAAMVLAIMPLYRLLLAQTASMALSFAAAVLAGALLYGVLNILLRTREMGLVVVGIAQRLTRRKKK